MTDQPKKKRGGARLDANGKRIGAGNTRKDGKPRKGVPVYLEWDVWEYRQELGREFSNRVNALLREDRKNNG